MLIPRCISDMGWSQCVHHLCYSLVVLKRKKDLWVRLSVSSFAGHSQINSVNRSSHLNLDKLCRFISRVLNLSQLFAPAGAAVCRFMSGGTTFSELRNWFCLARLYARHLHPLSWFLWRVYIKRAFYSAGSPFSESHTTEELSVTKRASEQR